MNEIILVQPRAGSWDLAGVRLPISMLSVAALPLKEGYKVKFIDQRIDKDWKNKLLKYLKDDPLLVAITSMTGIQIKYALEISKIVKENSNAYMVWGGQHATLYSHQTLMNKYIDIIVRNEGEITFLELIKTLEKEKDLRNVKGISFKDNGKIIKNKDRPFIDLNKLPDLPYELVDVKDYKGGARLRNKPSICISTSRGCPYRCTFCANPILNKRCWRGISAEKVIERIKYITDNFGIKDIYFQEDNFCGNFKRFKDIINLIIKEKLDIVWGTLGVRGDVLGRMDNDLLKKMEKSGCLDLDVGVESGSQRVLNLIKKDEKVEKFIEVNRKLRNYPFVMKYTFICGYPTETEEEMKMSIDLALKLAKENKNVYTPFCTATAYPGTEFFDLAVKHGLNIPNKLEEWSEFDQANARFNSHSWLTKKALKKCNNLAFTSWFANKNTLSNKITNQNFIVNTLFKIYYPFAKFRFSNNFHYLLFENRIMEKVLNIME